MEVTLQEKIPYQIQKPTRDANGGAIRHLPRFYCIRLCQRYRYTILVNIFILFCQKSIF